MKKKPNKKTIEALQEEDLNEWDSLKELIEFIESKRYVEKDSGSTETNK